jgi:hypothetical protein
MGERKELFGYVARHVVTKTKQIPLEGSSMEPQESVTDGWYVDADWRLSCDPKPSKQSTGHGLISAGLAVRPIERPQFVDIGAREMGFALKEVRTFPIKTLLEDGTRTTSPRSAESEVTALERVTLDPSLFEVPSGYKRVGRNRANSTE